MRRYRTEIVIPADRVVELHLPSHLPVGRAIVTVLIVEPEVGEDASAFDLDRHDIEWWEEFGGEAEESDDAPELTSRLSTFETQV